MVKRFAFLILVLALCALMLTASADSVVLQNGSVTITCEGLQPSSRYSFVASSANSKDQLFADGMLLYADQLTADDAGNFSLTFIHADLPDCTFWVGGAFKEGESSPRLAGTYTAAAEGVSFPTALEVIEDEAFAGSLFRQVVLGDKVTTIGAKAFQDCTALRRIVIPDSVTQIAGDAFDGCTDLTVVCGKDSTAWEYAIDHQFAIEIR